VHHQVIQNASSITYWTVGPLILIYGSFHSHLLRPVTSFHNASHSQYSLIYSSCYNKEFHIYIPYLVSLFANPHASPSPTSTQFSSRHIEAFGPSIYLPQTTTHVVCVTFVYKYIDHLHRRFLYENQTNFPQLVLSESSKPLLSWHVTFNWLNCRIVAKIVCICHRLWSFLGAAILTEAKLRLVDRRTHDRHMTGHMIDRSKMWLFLCAKSQTILVNYSAVWKSHYLLWTNLRADIEVFRPVVMFLTWALPFVRRRWKCTIPIHLS